MDLQGKWYYGLPCHIQTDKHSAKRGWYISNSVGIATAYDIRPETLGQFTGLKDKNGKEIYEGDVIENYVSDKPYSAKRKYCKVLYEVKYHEQKSADNEHNNKILAKDPSAFNTSPCFYGKNILNEKGYGCYSWSEFAGCEVIGSIYENPELLNPPTP